MRTTPGSRPEKAKSYAVDDMIVSVLWNGFTTVERTLIDERRPDAVQDFRHVFQLAMGSRFIGVVEAATSRSVVAYMSQVHTNPDMAVELFMLESSMDAVARGVHELEASQPVS